MMNNLRSDNNGSAVFKTRRFEKNPKRCHQNFQRLTLEVT